ncbi:fatty acid-binding protein, liver-like [Clupea harengus]|uniref:Fatty acid-binding protein, liver-like n=1 Tax=Clupea harengus TaxID=7950 RepID=A0A6P8GTI1_CLUHA|nr:fatty acid-binding protein, liver-like [Clupea harengus]
MAENFYGIWMMINDENYEEYLKELGVRSDLRKALVSLRVKPKSEVTISKDANGIVTIRSQRTNIKFKINEEFDETTGDDRKTKNVVSPDNGRLVQRQTWDGKETTIEREVVDNKLIVKYRMGDVVAVRTYVREA